MRLWYAWYPRDFMIDTLELSLEEEGLYRRMIDLYYVQGGAIPKNDRIAAKLLRCSPRTYRKHLPNLIRYFEEEDGLLYHKRIEAELDKSKKIQEVRSNAGRKGGKANAKQMLKDETSKCLSKTQSHTQSHKNKTYIPKSFDSGDFDIFWKCYPRKVDKKKAQRSFGKLINGKRQLAIDDCKNRYENTPKEFIPYPATYLNGEYWENDPEPVRTEKEKKPDWSKIPFDNERLWEWAKKHGYPSPGSQTYGQYRQKLTRLVSARLDREQYQK